MSEDDDEKRVALISALDDFAGAAMALDRAWLEAMDVTGDAMEGYPFQDSFDELTCGIVRWCRSCTAKLSRRLYPFNDDAQEPTAPPEKSEGKKTLETHRILPLGRLVSTARIVGRLIRYTMRFVIVGDPERPLFRPEVTELCASIRRWFCGREERQGEGITEPREKRLTLEEIERLPDAEFAALPEEEKQRYFDWMDRENSPSAWEFYGYDKERDTEDDEFSDSMFEYYRDRGFEYAKADALSGRPLIDASEMAREAGFRTSVALTRAVWAHYVAVPVGVECRDEAGRLWDVLWMCWCGISCEKCPGSALFFRVPVRNDNREGEPPLVRLKAVCGPADDGSPCLTIMLPDED
jgi:hypothetical protein